MPTLFDKLFKTDRVSQIRRNHWRKKTQRLTVIAAEIAKTISTIQNKPTGRNYASWQLLQEDIHHLVSTQRISGEEAKKKLQKASLSSSQIVMQMFQDNTGSKTFPFEAALVGVNGKVLVTYAERPSDVVQPD